MLHRDLYGDGFGALDGALVVAVAGGAGAAEHGIAIGLEGGGELIHSFLAAH